MGDNKSEEKDKKRTKHTTKIVYHRCNICGGRKREENMSFVTGKEKFCQECYDKQSYRNNTNANVKWIRKEVIDK